MKRKISLLLFLFIMFLSSFNIINAFSLFEKTWSKLPYCSDEDNCWLLEWIEILMKSWIKWLVTEWTASEYIQIIIVFLLGFLKLVAIIIIIYAWFNMLISAWDEEKFKKSKKIIIFAIIWLAIIYLAWPITSFIINIFTIS
jgi:hypothetical protein